MKKAVRLHIVGSMQSMFFKEFIKSNADAHNVKGFLRFLENGKIEVFLEGNSQDVDAVVTICSRGPKYATVRSVEAKEERMQEFKDFKVLSF